VRFLFILAAFLSSTLLFMVEPLAAKIILPTFGGAPAVWNTAMLFFQTVLLFGYGYAHFSTSKLRAKPHAYIHLFIFTFAAVALPISRQSPWFQHVRQLAAADQSPIPLIFLALIGLIGLPFFALSANSSTLQKWYSRTSQPDAKHPWFLYSAGNIGSILALVAYPSIIEPRLNLSEQGKFWAIGYGLLLLFLAGCAWFGSRPQPLVSEEDAGEAPDEAPNPTSKDRWTWLALSAVPSSLLLGVTTYLTSNIAPIPLLWVVPLALYLLTFIFVFARKPITPAKQLGRIYPLILTPLIVVLVLEATSPQLAVLHLAVFFVAAWMCHSRLAIHKPHAKHLTEFFFYVSLGGVVGGVFNAIVAPLVFNTLAEYPAALVMAALLMPKRDGLKSKPLFDAIYPAAVAGIMIAIVFGAKLAGLDPGPLKTFLTIGIPAILCFLAVDSPTRFGLTIAAGLLVASGLHVASDGSVAFTARSFFGVHRVILKDKGRIHELVNGNTIHGIENFDHLDLPLTYYYPNGPIGQVMTSFKPRTAALVGLGVGSLAAYGRPGDRFTYYEIDPIVVAIATDTHWFTFLRDTKANVNIRLGDARLELSASRSTYDLIVLDAFSSDAIPIHLLTTQAIEMYLRHLKPHGLLAFHISNRYLDFEPILSAACRELGLLGQSQEDGATDEERLLGKTQSKWVVVARTAPDFKQLPKDWGNDLEPTRKRAWTDDYSNVLGAFKMDE
jgi:hypothetical protein